MNGYVKYVNDNKCMNLLVPVEELLKKYHKIWDKINNLLKKDLIMKQYIVINTLKLRKKFTIMEQIQIFKVIKYQKILNAALVCL